MKEILLILLQTIQNYPLGSVFWVILLTICACLILLAISEVVGALRKK